MKTLFPRIPSLLPLAILPGLLLAACDGDDGDGSIGSAPSGSFDALLATTPTPEIFAFEAEMASVELVRDDGGSSGNLLAGGADAELVSLADVALWTVAADVAPGTYLSARVTFAPSSFAAKLASGAPVEVEAVSLELAAPLDAPLVVEEDGYARVEIHLDLVASLTASTIDPGVVAFDPVGSAVALKPAEAEPLAPFFGIVTSASLAAQMLEVQVFRDPELTQPLRTVDVELASNALLIDLDDTVFPGVEEFFAALIPGKTVVEVEGSLLDSGSVLATEIEILSHSGASDPKVVITGKVLEVDAGIQQFVLLVQHIDQGADIAEPILASLADPNAIDVTWNPSTVFLGHGGDLLDASDLSSGQMVQVEFATFSSPPFLAAKVELLGINLTGTIHDVDSLPSSFVLRLGGGELVTVRLSEATELLLDTQFKPAIQTEEIVVGMKATVKNPTGAGDPVEEGLDAESVKVHHGYLVQADVAAAEELASTFWTSSGHIAQTFGDLAPEGPLEVVIQPGCLFGQDADGEASFFDLVDSAGELDIKVKGVGSPVPGRIHAYEIKAKQKP